MCPAPVIALDHPAAFDAARVGRKAAALARARAGGLPVGEGVVLTADWDVADRTTAHLVWRIMSHDGARPLVVRPSAVGRDRVAGDGSGGPCVVHRADAVVAAAAALRSVPEQRDLPVLVQPHLAAPWHGSLFAPTGGGRRARSVVLANGPAAREWVAELDSAGNVRDVLSDRHPDHPPVRVLNRLAAVAGKVAATFGEPHDLEWALDGDGRLHLLRLRPVVQLRSTTGPRRAARPATPHPRPVLIPLPDPRAEEPAA